MSVSFLRTMYYTCILFEYSVLYLYPVWVHFPEVDWTSLYWVHGLNHSAPARKFVKIFIFYFFVLRWEICWTSNSLKSYFLPLFIDSWFDLILIWIWILWHVYLIWIWILWHVYLVWIWILWHVYLIWIWILWHVWFESESFDTFTCFESESPSTTLSLPSSSKV